MTRTALRIQALLGDEALISPRLQGGFDPRSRVAEVVWGDDGADLVPVEGEWVGGVPEGPATVLDDPLPVELVSADPMPTSVRVDPRGSLTSSPGGLVRRWIDEAEPRKRGDAEIFGGRDPLPVTVVAGPWVVLGRWWERMGERGPKAYLRVRVQTEGARGSDLLLVQRKEGWFVDGVYAELREDYSTHPADRLDSHSRGDARCSRP